MPFTKEKALALIAHANTAPLQNMQHAGGVSALLQEFAQWADEVFEKIEAKIAPPSHPAPAAAEAIPEAPAPKVEPKVDVTALPVQVTPETLPVEADQPTEASPAS